MINSILPKNLETRRYFIQVASKYGTVVLVILYFILLFSQNVKDDDSFSNAFDTFKKIADRKGEIVENELRAIVGQVENKENSTKLISVSVNSKDEYASAKVTLKVGSNEVTEEATGDGMIHAAFTAVKKILDSDATLIDYRVESITKGSDATAEIVTIINDGHLMKQGRAVSTDVVQGSVESFLNALNK